MHANQVTNTTREIRSGMIELPQLPSTLAWVCARACVRAHLVDLPGVAGGVRDVVRAVVGGEHAADGLDELFHLALLSQVGRVTHHLKNIVHGHQLHLEFESHKAESRQG